MSWFYRSVVRPALFTQDPEDIHHRTMQALGWISRRPLLRDCVESFLSAPALPLDLFGLRFPNPVGLAAGMDKDATALPAWEALGFGFCEVGTVTRRAQPGNPRPRLFRIADDEAVINRMGFNNSGAEAMATTLTTWREQGLWPDHPVGINLGKSKITPLDMAAEDYASSFRLLRPHGDFFIVNVSSPNTPDLRKLQDKAALDEILAAVQESNVATSRESAAEITVQKSATHSRAAATPVLVKVAPDLSFEAVDEILELVSPRQLAGIIATNTTIARPQTNDAVRQRIYAESGGLSGKPLHARSTEIIRHIHRQTRGRLPIIGVGGIFTADDAWEKITAGASLVEVYTGLVYEGPGFARQIVCGLVARLEETGLRSLQEAVGADNR